MNHVKNLDFLSSERARVRLLGIIAHAQSVLQQQILPLRPPPHWDLFCNQFDCIAARYKFFVLEGRSRTGKTYFVRNHTGNPADVYQMNCASGAEPDLREFNWFVHTTVLFDEAHPDMVLKQRLLFQSQPAMVRLGMSTTNCHSYEVCLFQKKLVICANGWSRQVQGLRDSGRVDDADWLVANSFHADIGNYKLFEEHINL